MEKSDILIIGAGAAGLMAAFRLSESGKKVTILEARNRLGGRIHTIEGESFFKFAELGAEFVHGNLPVTLNLLTTAGIAYGPAGGEMVQYANGAFKQEGESIEQWDLLMKKLGELKEDISLTGFLEKEFSGDAYTTLRTAVNRYVAGYDTADPDKASAFALRREWQNEDEDAQHRIEGGYGRMITYLANKCKLNGGVIYLNTVVKEIHWHKDETRVITDTGIIYAAAKVVIALPLGVLQAKHDEPGAIIFDPPLVEQQNAITALGFGDIIKFLLEFDDAFWEDDTATQLAGKSLKNMSFLISDEEIPTWWTQHPDQSAMLTGWLGGPPAKAKQGLSNEQLLHLSLESLSHIFKTSVDALKTKLIAWNVVNWTADPFSRGSYSYDTVAAPAARKVLNAGVENILFFTGEYLYEGTAMGTVEAAVTSGEEVVKRILG